MWNTSYSSYSSSGRRPFGRVAGHSFAMPASRGMRLPGRVLSCAALVVAGLVLAGTARAAEVLDFEGFEPGDFVDEIILGGILNGTDGVVVVDGRPYYDGVSNAAMVFNSGCGKQPLPRCSGGDRDLSTDTQGNILIISRDGDAVDPDDIDSKNRDRDAEAVFEFDFSGVGAITIYSLSVIDVESSGAYVALTDTSGAQMQVAIAPTGDGGIGTVEFGTGGTGVENVVTVSINMAGDGAVDDLVFEPKKVTLAQDCVNPLEGKCDLYTFLDLPDNIQLEPEDTIIQFAPDIYVDPRVNPLTGRCDGGGAEPRGTLTLFGSTPDQPELVIPDFLCGSPYFGVLRVDKNDFDVLSGTVEHVVDAIGLIPGNQLECEDPITPGSPGSLYPDPLGDPQLSDAFVWQPKDRHEVAEGRAIELTNGCINPSKGKTIDLSYIVAGLHIDFGCDYAQDPDCVFNGFVGLVLDKLVRLQDAVAAAEPFIDNDSFVLLSNSTRLAEAFVMKGDYGQASKSLGDVAAIANGTLGVGSSAVFEPSDFNHQGNIESRAANVKFLLDTRIVPFE